ncbi:MAG: NACHT domain-containing protein [Hormoscilla sp. GM7CHS1pb]|nr:NACHT domain-containing protein [Hormoscilla sp. GM7CHS1pb]
MDLDEVLKLADDLVFARTGNHLNDLQEMILRGTWSKDSYDEIAKKVNLSEPRVREVGMKLWQILSQELGEKVKKSNFRTVMERRQNSNVLNFAQDVVVSGSFNICRETIHPPDIPNSHPDDRETSNSKQPQNQYRDLSEMPDLGAFYDRASELATLRSWILEQRCRLIALTGMSGIGKTALAVQLVQQIKDEFEYVVWYNLETFPTPDKFQARLIKLFTQSEKPDTSATNQKSLPQIEYLQKHRCLVVLDDIHNLFCSGELAGKYQPESSEYRALFKQIEKLSHQSCFLLVGWEQPREFPPVKSKNHTIRTLQLRGLSAADAEKILKDNGIEEIKKCSALMHHYQGNPLWLKSVATLMVELGGGVTELLPDETILISADLQDIFQQQFDRLSPLEKQVISLIARSGEAVKLAKLLENSIIPPSELLNALQSLSRRCLIEQEASLYKLIPVVRQYVISSMQEAEP